MLFVVFTWLNLSSQALAFEQKHEAILVAGSDVVKYLSQDVELNFSDCFVAREGLGGDCFPNESPSVFRPVSAAMSILTLDELLLPLEYRRGQWNDFFDFIVLDALFDYVGFNDAQ